MKTQITKLVITNEQTKRMYMGQIVMKYIISNLMMSRKYVGMTSIQFTTFDPLCVLETFDFQPAIDVLLPAKRRGGQTAGHYLGMPAGPRA